MLRVADMNGEALWRGRRHARLTADTLDVGDVLALFKSCTITVLLAIVTSSSSAFSFAVLFGFDGSVYGSMNQESLEDGTLLAHVSYLP